MVEVRLLDQKTNRLEPLLALGMRPEAANRVLYALPQNNGVTGFVAATGKSYLCEDTDRGPALPAKACGAPRVRLTVPLLWHDEVIGTFNVESVEPRAFSESDLQFLEIFSRDVAAALNTLELLVAEKGDHGGRERRGHPQRRGPAGGRNPQRGGQRHGALHRPRAGSRRAAAAHPPQRPRHQAGHPEGRAEDGPGPGPSAGGRRWRSGRRCGAAACWWSTPTRTSAAPPTPCWTATAARWRRPTTAPRPSAWSAPCWTPPTTWSSPTSACPT